jgi:hypothetical protein
LNGRLDQLAETGDAEARMDVGRVLAVALASPSSTTPRRCAAATQTTMSRSYCSASSAQRSTTLRSSWGGVVSRVELLTPS